MRVCKRSSNRQRDYAMLHYKAATIRDCCCWSWWGWRWGLSPASLDESIEWLK